MLLDLLGEALADAASKNGWTPPGDADRVPIEVPRDPSYGDLSTNLALILAKQVSRPPREVAERLVASLSVGEEILAGVDKVQVFTWNGGSLAGARVPSGFYSIRAVARVTDNPYAGPPLTIAVE